MSVLEIENLRFSYADNELYNNVGFRVFEKDHLGLIGINGSGKSTLLKLIANKLTPDAGCIRWFGNKTFSYLDQHLEVDANLCVRDFLLGVFCDLFAVEKKLNALYLDISRKNNPEALLVKADAMMNYLLENDFYAIKSKVDNVINGLGLGLVKENILKNLSGGERIKVFLAKMLLEERDVLLLDEPTNFLDAGHITWLGKFLSTYQHEFIVVSHDFEFLNICCNGYLDLDNKQVNKYKGDFDGYLKAKSLTRALYIKRYLHQQKEIKQINAFVEKNIVRASTAKRAQSRRKQLAKMVILEKPQKEKEFTFSFPFTKSFNLSPLIVKKLAIGYSFPLLKEINLDLAYGKKYVITGKNGIGKTTFVKTILGIIPRVAGFAKLSSLNDVNYFPQDVVFGDMTPIEFVKDKYPKLTDFSVRKLLAGFLLTGDLVLKKMTELSGGEQTRTRLALASLAPSNLLVLDEPTNHLDKAGKGALFDAILNYPGTVIMVSHDREFYRHLNMIEIKFQ